MFLQEHSGDLRFFLWRTRRALTGKTDLRYVIEIKLVEDGYRNNGTGKMRRSGAVEFAQQLRVESYRIRVDQRYAYCRPERSEGPMDSARNGEIH